MPCFTWLGEFSHLFNLIYNFCFSRILGTGDSKKLSRREILDQNLPELCHSIIEMVPERHRGSATKTGLYLLSLLTYGTVLIHQVQVDFLKRELENCIVRNQLIFSGDVEKLKELMKKKSFILLMAERFDRNQELQRKEDKFARLRSKPIMCVEELDRVDLAHLQAIGDELGVSSS